jgi:hypothetical protein
MEWFQRSNKVYQDFPGFVSRRLLRSTDGSYAAIVEHEGETTFMAMHTSPERETMWAEVEPLLQAGRSRRSSRWSTRRTQSPARWEPGHDRHRSHQPTSRHGPEDETFRALRSAVLGRRVSAHLRGGGVVLLRWPRFRVVALGVEQVAAPPGSSRRLVR